MDLLHRFITDMFIALYPLKIYGKENLPKGKAILVCNHFRAIDCGYVAKLYGKDIKFLAKKELFDNKTFAGIIGRFGAVPVDRDNPDIGTMLSIIKFLKKDGKVCVFPEGTRNKTGTTELQELKAGPVMFALMASCPIVPIMLKGKGKIFRKQVMMVGKPFEFKEYYGKKTDKETNAKLNDVVRDKMLETQKKLEKKLLKKSKGKHGNNKRKV